MKNTLRIMQTLLITLLILLFYSCNKDEPKIIKEKVTGHVQKGPYINGTSISMSELNSSLAQTGKIFTAQISNNSGSFEIKNISLTSSYVEFSASGFYFDEVKGALSIAPLNLFALSDITDISTVNVNILTHLEKLRVEYLVEHNKTFSEAKKIAQGEILAIFGFSLSGMDNSEELDISVNNEGNAILLAISIILQGKLSVGDLTELLANISNDIREDGILNSESIKTSLRNSAKELVLTTIRSNLVSRYQELGISASIPGFEKYVNDFLVFTGQKPVTTTQPATNITATSATIKGVVNANSLSTTVTFEYGSSISYFYTITATQSPVTGNANSNISAAITELLPNTIYHFRVKAANELGITFGNDVSFITQNGIVTLSTTSITSKTATSASSGGSITVDGGASVTARGVCWNTSVNPTIALSTKTTDGAGTGVFTSSIIGLTAGTTYYVRAYATNSIGTSYGTQISFTTLGPPTVTTATITEITQTTATGGGNIISDGGASITARGVCWSTFSNPTIADSKTTNGTGTGSFTSSITGSSSNTTYYVRAYATNSAFTAYGNEITFILWINQPGPQVNDIDGNTYNSVKIGNQIWMAENLKTTKYKNGTSIPNVTNNEEWGRLSTPAYCWYNNDAPTNKANYGAMYNWYTVSTGNLCPAGWHVPSYVQWTTLTTYLGGIIGAGGKLKEAGTTHWDSPNTGAINETGFTALPGGSCNISWFANIRGYGHWWSSTEGGTYNAGALYMSYLTSDVTISYNGYKYGGFSVRCLKDN